MPFSSGRSVRAPASKATSTVVERVGSSTRCRGRPFGREEDSMRAIELERTAGELAAWGDLGWYSRPPDVWQPQNDICVVAGIATTRIARPLLRISPPRAR